MLITVEPWAEVRGYAEFAARIPEAMVTFSPTWLDLIQHTAGGDGYIVTARGHGELAAVLPFFISPDRGQGRVLNSLPFFGSSSGVLLDTALEESGLIGAMLDVIKDAAQDHGCRSLVVISSLLDSAGKNRAYREALQPDHEDYRLGQATMLPGAGADLLERLAPCKRNNIRNALRQGVSVRRSDEPQDWQWVCRRHNVRMEAMGGRAKPESFSRWGLEAIKHNPACRLTIAELDGQRCAGLLTIQHGRFTEYAFPVSDWELRASKGICLLIYESMQYSIDAGKEIYNFGGTWKTQKSLYEFKKRFGATDFKYFYFIKILDKSLYRSNAEELSEGFPMYYVIPFEALNQSTKV